MRVLLLTALIVFWFGYSARAGINEKYSYKDFMNQSFKHLSASEFNGKGDIVGSCFYQHYPIGKDVILVKGIFPTSMTGITFKKCNLDNVLVPEGNIIEKSNSHRKIRVENDMDYWILDDNLKPIEPTTKDWRLRAGVSIDPKDIPTKMVTKEEREAYEAILESSSNISP